MEYFSAPRQFQCGKLCRRSARAEGGRPSRTELESQLEGLAERREMTIQSIEQFKALIENSLDIITVLDADGVLTYVSPSVKRVLGYEPDSLVGGSALQWIHPDDLEFVRQALTNVLGSPDRINSVEFRFRHSLGDWRSFEAVGTRLPTPIAGGIIVVNARDVTEHRKTVNKLRLLATA